MATNGNVETFTVKLAGLLVTLPAVLLTTHSYRVPLLTPIVAGVMYEAPVAPVIAEYVPAPGASCCHWQVGEGAPVAATVKVAVCGEVTVALTGCVVIVGGAAVEETVNVTALLVTLPDALLTTHAYLVPLLDVVVAAVVQEALVAPVMFANIVPNLVAKPYNTPLNSDHWLRCKTC